MPSSTFFNLPEGKRKLIEDIALQHFASHDFDAVSISAIVRESGIAKGSFYQYFENKKDLFHHIFKLGVQLKLTYLQTGIQGKSASDKDNPGSDNGGLVVDNEASAVDNDDLSLFDTLRIVFRQGILYARENPEHMAVGLRVLNRPDLLEEVFQRLNSLQKQFFIPLFSRARSRGQISSDLDDDFLIFMIGRLNLAITEYCTEKDNENISLDLLTEYANRLINILEFGIPGRRDN